MSHKQTSRPTFIRPRAELRSARRSATALGFLVAIVGAANAAPAVPPMMAGNDTIIAAAVAEASTRFAIPAGSIRAVIQVESAGNTTALSPKGAIGLMQIMPATWETLRPRYNLGSNPFDAHDNILAGTALMRELYDRFGPSGFLAAYNAGPSRYLAYLTQGVALKGETRHYLTKLAGLLPEGQIGDAIIAPAALPDWRSASLFVAAWRPPQAEAATKSQPNLTAYNSPPMPQSNDQQNPIPSRLEPRAAGLFAAFNQRVAP